MDLNDGYPEAKRVSKEKYGDKYKVSNVYIKVAEWPAIKPDVDVALDWCSTL